MLTIEKIIDDDNLTSIAAFHSEQALEKCFKAILCEQDLDIDSRYPVDFGLLPNSKPTILQAKEFYEFTKSIYEKIKARLEIGVVRI